MTFLKGELAMYKNLLVAVDGSDQANHALHKASQLVQPLQAQLTIGHVIDTRNVSWIAIDEGDLWLEIKQRAEQLIDQHVQRAKSFGIDHINTKTKSGNPRIEIPENLTVELNIDLLILGSSGKNAVERRIIGSVTDAAVRRSPCDVLTVKKGSEQYPVYKHLLIAVDGSKQAETALTKAIRLANIFQAKLYIAHINEHDSSQQVQQNLEDMIEQYRHQAEQQGVKDVITIIEQGNPRELIPNQLTTTYDIDLLITAATGRGMFERLFTGSVALSALHHAPCDVLTVKAK